MLSAGVITSKLAPVDFAVILALLATTLAIGIVMSRRARQDTASYFKTKGSLPWWLLGTSMVATTFAADTPLAIAGMVVQDGISMNWYWWCQVPAVVGGVLFFAHLWRRANPMTDMEFVDQRYSGPSAAGLRGFKAGYLALIYGAIIMGWVNKAMGTVLSHLFPELPRVALLDKAIYAVILATPMHTAVSSDGMAMIRGGLGHESAPFLAAYDDLRDNYYANGAAKGIAVRFETLEDIARWTDDEARIWNQTIADYGIDLPAASAKVGTEAEAPYADVELARDVKQLNAMVNQLKILLFLFVLVLVYTAISGLWGVVVTDFLQFWIAMAGCIYLAFRAVRELGGMHSMLEQMGTIYGTERAAQMVSVMPDAGSSIELSRFLVYVLISWWAVGFTDGGSFFAQRLLSAKNGFHAAMGYLWYAVAHFALRMWPWLIVGFAAAVMFPYTADSGMDAEAGFVKVMLAVLGPGILGILVASFFAAYMSTISTHLNLGASYLVNDLYRPFVAKGRTEKHYLRMSMVMTALMAATGMIVSLFMTSIVKAWFLLAAFQSGIGIIYLLRWYWWRINAWSEIVCLASLILLAAGTHWFAGDVVEIARSITGNPELWPSWKEYTSYPLVLLYTLPISFVAAMAATFLTKPVDREKLIAFCRRVQPGGAGWRAVERDIRARDPQYRAASPLRPINFLNWILGTFVVYAYLWGIGMLIVGNVPGVDHAVDQRALGVLLILAGTGLLAWFIHSLRKEPIVDEQ